MCAGGADKLPSGCRDSAPNGGTRWTPTEPNGNGSSNDFRELSTKTTCSLGSIEMRALQGASGAVGRQVRSAMTHEVGIPGMGCVLGGLRPASVIQVE
jgi:hypothetical protein